jgi:hypothetical protein
MMIAEFSDGGVWVYTPRTVRFLGYAETERRAWQILRTNGFGSMEMVIR